jgi:hypothetical protein
VGAVRANGSWTRHRAVLSETTSPPICGQFRMDVSDPDFGHMFTIDSTSGGVGLFDCDDDGRLDVVLINGSTVERYRAGGDPLVTLYHQEADGTFKDITKEAGLTRRGWGMGVAVALRQ